MKATEECNRCGEGCLTCLSLCINAVRTLTDPPLLNGFDMMRLRKIFSVAAVSFGLLVCWCLCDQFWALTHTTWRPTVSAPLSPDEIHRMGAVDAVEDYCNTATDLTAKGESLRRRFVENRSDAATAALKEAKESFRNVDCNQLLIRFEDMMQRVEF